MPNPEGVKFQTFLDGRPRTHRLAIPCKHPVALVVRFLKARAQFAIGCMCDKERNFSGERFRPRGWAVSTVEFKTGANPQLHPRAGSCGSLQIDNSELLHKVAQRAQSK